MANQRQWARVGHIAGVFGVRGWLKVYSYTDPRGNILNYLPWSLEPKSGGDSTLVRLISGKQHGKGIIAQLEGVDDPQVAAALIGHEIMVPSDQFPATEPGEYYWSDLIGLNVVTLDGEPLGRVESILETGANDVLVVKSERQRLIPFLQPQVVTRVDIEGGIIRVDWDADF